MKKLALLLTLVLVFSLSCVLATDVTSNTAPEIFDLLTASGEDLSGDNDTTEAISGDVVDEEQITSGENGSQDTEVVSGEDNESGESGELVDTTKPTDDESNTTTKDPSDDATTSNNSAIVGAIIAIVIVIAVVAIAAILRKD